MKAGERGNGERERWEQNNTKDKKMSVDAGEKSWQMLTVVVLSRGDGLCSWPEFTCLILAAMLRCVAFPPVWVIGHAVLGPCSQFRNSNLFHIYTEISVWAKVWETPNLRARARKIDSGRGPLRVETTSQKHYQNNSTCTRPLFGSMPSRYKYNVSMSFFWVDMWDNMYRVTVDACSTPSRRYDIATVACGGISSILKQNVSRWHGCVQDYRRLVDENNSARCDCSMVIRLPLFRVRSEFDDSLSEGMYRVSMDPGWHSKPAISGCSNSVSNVPFILD